ncbi:LppP/LprE family lipoprotein [Nocardia bovistercoris]|uniref:LppP/LprE family lipoprotein n=1 Tax=Nocardia bovistercoris TaxID=2785916 RepID=A0A931N747_9NOCA|nr:LppP/LprE family lipoprotein [Nocardia bovistercoris]
MSSPEPAPPTSDAPTSAQVPDGPVTAGAGRCLDPNSPLVAAAISSLGFAPGGNPFAVERTSDAAVGSCPALLWALVGTPHGTASSPSHVLFFAHAGYLGTATTAATPYTEVVGSSDRTVEVRYRWLDADEPNCCPAGGPTVITFTLGADGDTITPNPAIPNEVGLPVR